MQTTIKYERLAFPFRYLVKFSKFQVHGLFSERQEMEPLLSSQGMKWESRMCCEKQEKTDIYCHVKEKGQNPGCYFSWALCLLSSTGACPQELKEEPRRQQPCLITWGRPFSNFIDIKQNLWVLSSLFFFSFFRFHESSGRTSLSPISFVAESQKWND